MVVPLSVFFLKLVIHYEIKTLSSKNELRNPWFVNHIRLSQAFYVQVFEGLYFIRSIVLSMTLAHFENALFSAWPGL